MHIRIATGDCNKCCVNMHSCISWCIRYVHATLKTNSSCFGHDYYKMLEKLDITQLSAYWEETDVFCPHQLRFL